MAPLSTLSPAELSYLHTSLSLTPPIRPDARASTQFRPLIAERDMLPGTNGSARICFADGTEAVVGVKAEVEKAAETAGDVDTEGGGAEWVELSIEIPGLRDDDALPVFVARMLGEALVASGDLPGRLRINSRWHWKLHVDILLLSPPLSYPLPLLSLTTHLALLSTRLPLLKSEGDEDPLFDDDWDAAVSIYPQDATRPPVTLLVTTVGQNIIYDPSREELAVADAAVAISVVGEAPPPSTSKAARRLRLQAIRSIDPPSRLTPPGTALSIHPGGDEKSGVWCPPQGGIKRSLITRIVAEALTPGGVADEVLDGLESVA